MLFLYQGQRYASKVTCDTKKMRENTNLNKNEVSKEKMDNTAYVKEIMEEYSSYKEVC